MFELNIRAVVAGGELVTGRGSLLSPENTVHGDHPALGLSEQNDLE